MNVEDNDLSRDKSSEHNALSFRKRKEERKEKEKGREKERDI